MKKVILDFWHERQGLILQVVLAGIMLLFFGIMIAVYLVAREADPVLLDEKGRPRHSHEY